MGNPLSSVLIVGRMRALDHLVNLYLDALRPLVARQCKTFVTEAENAVCFGRVAAALGAPWARSFCGLVHTNAKAAGLQNSLAGGRSRVLHLGKTLSNIQAITAGMMAAPGGETIVVPAKRMQSRAGSPTRECIDLAQSR
jgi:hypothetical protein